MSKNFRNHVAATLCALALVLTAAAVEAQSEDPILDDELMCCITLDEVVWAVPVAYQPQLEAYLGQPGVIRTARELLDVLPPAGPTNAVHIEGGYPGLGFAQGLDALGYTMQITLDPTEVPGTLTGVLRTN